MRFTSALMPATQFSANDSDASASSLIDCSMQWGQNGFVDVELEMALTRGNGDGGVIAEHLAAHHRQGFGLRRIDLARHDRGAGFVFPEDQFAEPRTRARAQQADVVGDLEQAAGKGVQRAVREHVGVVGGKRLELVGCASERQAA